MADGDVHHVEGTGGQKLHLDRTPGTRSARDPAPRGPTGSVHDPPLDVVDGPRGDDEPEDAKTSKRCPCGETKTASRL